jgi:GntR family transcriptional regulator
MPDGRGGPPAGLRKSVGPLAPLYYRVFRTLEQRIRDGRYTRGDRLPTEDRLCREFKASRITIREAVGRLVDLGLVVRRRGSGTFVSDQEVGKAEAPLQFTAVLEDLFAQVETVQTKAAQVTEEVPPLDVARLLGLDNRVPVTVVRRIRAYRDQVFSLTFNYLPLSLGVRLREGDLYGYPLLRLLEEKHGVRFRWAEQTIEARTADDEVAAALDIRFGDPVLYVQRLMFTRIGYPLEVVRSHYRGDMYRYRVRLARSRGAPFRWRLGGPIPDSARGPRGSRRGEAR